MNLNTTIFSKLAFVFGLLISLSGFSQQGMIAKNNARIHDYAVSANGEEPKNVFSIFPASVKKSARILVEAENDGWATFELRNSCGELLLEQQMAVNKGSNSVPLFYISGIEKGVYDTVLKVEDKVYHAKLIKE